MKKKLLILFLILSTFKISKAQNPYGVYQIPYNPQELSSASALSLGDDYYSGVINIGFPFTFFGQEYQTLLISSNGYVRFDVSNANSFSDFSVNQSLPDPSAPLNSVFLSWFDLNPFNDLLISYETVGQAPNRTFIVQYSNVPYFSCMETEYTGQLQLHEGSNNIDMHIESKPLCNDGNSSWSNFSIQGIQNLDATQSYHVPGRNNNGIWQASNDAWRFDPDTSNAAACIMTGRVIADFNGNCILDESDYALPNQVVIRDVNQAYVTTNQSGVFSFEADTGNYQINFNGLNSNLPFGTINCPADAVFNLSLMEAGSIADSLDFYVYPDSSCADPQISISPMGPFRRCAGNDNHQVIYVTNHGMLPIQEYSVSLTIPDSLYLYNTSPAYSSQDGNTYTWNFSDTLLFGELTTIHLYDSLNCFATDGLLKCMTASLTNSTDCNLDNNSSEICQIVNGSYDPIQLLSAPPTPQYVYNMEVEGTEQWYTYRIQFQNTGTAPAQTVAVTDILPPFFDYLSAELLGSSHECMLVNEGNGTLHFVHYFINLPDSSENFEESIGTVLFKVRANQMLFPGQEIANRASIVFDVNEPVITNDAIFGVPLPTGFSDSNEGFRLFPNPVDQSLKIFSEINEGTIEIVDLSGRIILTQKINSNQTMIETTQLPSGMYFLNLRSQTQNVSTQKLVVKH
jgi:uncharacterized repeat protein (TIGR01451 family)